MCKRKHKRILFLLILILLISSCYLDSKNPLCKIEDAILDDRLLGLWEFIDSGDSVGYLLISKTDDKCYQFFLFESDFSTGGHFSFNGFITEINDEKYLNLQFLEVEDGEINKINETSYILAHYNLNKNRLKIALFNAKLFENGIKNNLLAGKDINITASSDSLKDFIKKQKLEDLLDKESKYLFKRVKYIKQK